VDSIIKVDYRPIIFGQAPLNPGVLIKFEGSDQIYTLKKFSQKLLELSSNESSFSSFLPTGAIYVSL